MRNASKTSKQSPDRPRTAPDSNPVETAEFWRLERKRQYKLLAPPNVPHRRKEARRWLDELTVRCTNGSLSERRPDQRYLTMKESQALRIASLEKLSKTDPELHRAVSRMSFETATRDLGITMDLWRKRAYRRALHISKVRAEMQRAGLI